MDIRTFLAKHPVFTRSELDSALAGDYSGGKSTGNARLQYHLKKGHIIQIKRGLYAAVPTGEDPGSFTPDPYLVTTKLARDAVIAYHSAFQFLGRAYSLSNDYIFLSDQTVRPHQFRGCRFRRVAHPQPLRSAGETLFGIETGERQGLDVRVTSFERSLVDLLDRPHLGGSWEEIWRSLESVEYYNIDQVMRYAALLNNATTAVKVGFFLEQHQKELMVEDEYLARLRKFRPRHPHYMEKGKEGRLMSDWNLIVPETLLNRLWEAEG